MQRQKLFSIELTALEGAHLDVMRFRGREDLQSLYRFTIRLAGDATVIPGSSLVNTAATLVHHAAQGDFRFSGIVSRFTVLHQADSRTFYQMVLVPRLWRATLDSDCRVFLNKSAPECIQASLEQLGFAHGVDFTMQLQQDYPRREYIARYNESTYDFISRWMEREGIYLYFDHSGEHEKAIFTDSKSVHAAVQGASPLQYAPPSGLDGASQGLTLTRFGQRTQRVPGEVLVKDYNYRTPSLEITATSQVSDSGEGLYYSYADNAKNPGEAKRLATVKAQSRSCREAVCQGESISPFVRAGFLFTVQGHFLKDLNAEYLATSVQHVGKQEGYLFSGLENKHDKDVYFYRNTFEAQASGSQYRRLENTPRPVICGASRARVTASESGQYAELDQHGRYRLIMPWDRNPPQASAESYWVRMAQPYGGGGHGMHLPLHKGVEVMLGHLDGDPDRPVIEGAVPDPEHPSQTTNQTQTQCRLTTGGQNKMHIEDAAGNQRILLHSPAATTYARLGSHNDPPPDWSESEDMAGWKLHTNKLFDVEAGSKNTVILGNSFTNILGWEHRQTGGARTGIVLGLHTKIALAYVKEFTPLENTIHALGVRMGIEKSKLIDEKIHMAEERLDTAQEHVSLANNKTKLAQQRTHLSEQNTALATQKTDLAQQATELAESKTTLVENSARLAQTSLHTADEKVEMAEDIVTMAMNRIETYEDAMETVQSKVSLATSYTEIAESINEVCSEKVSIAAEQNDM